MAASNYDESLRLLLVHEGGYTNHPSDPGGPTNFGITIYDYRKYVKPGATAVDVKVMKLSEAKTIYRAKYWDAQRCDELPSGVDYAIFDYGVNSGTGRSQKVLQRVLGVTVDGRIGDQTIAAASERNPKTLVTAICDERLRFLKGLRTWPVFGKGWGRRVAEVRAVALAMIAKAPAPKPLPEPAPGRAEVPLPKAAQHGSAGAVLAAGAAAAQQAHQNGMGPGEVTTIIIVGVVAAVAAYAFWRWRQKQQQEMPA
jgi:lysozyme family protein